MTLLIIRFFLQDYRKLTELKTLSFIGLHHMSPIAADVVDGITSEPAPLLYGVPQGSVLGPILITMYTQPLSKVIEEKKLLLQEIR